VYRVNVGAAAPRDVRVEQLIASRRHGEISVASNRTVYHVVPNANAQRWVISIEDDDSFREEYDTKAEAVEAAKRRARSREPAQVKVHKHDGNMEYESTYGDDPRRSPG